MEIEERIDAAAQYIQTKLHNTPMTGIVLGSGLADFADMLKDPVSIDFAEIPGFPVPTVSGHHGQIVAGWCENRFVIVQKGRIHYYEGVPQNELTIPVRVMKKLGIQTLILTNAAGGINLNYKAGSLMLIADHINFSGSNPLIGPNLDNFGPRFPDMGNIYTKELRIRLKEAAAKENIALNEGIYVMYSGPNYETPAEIRCFRTLGADAAGMSTVPEALTASHCEMQVIGISCITNMAAGVLPQRLDHREVMKAAEQVKDDFIKVLSAAVRLAGESQIS